jgi:hypothetical protein
MCANVIPCSLYTLSLQNVAITILLMSREVTSDYGASDSNGSTCLVIACSKHHNMQVQAELSKDLVRVIRFVADRRQSLHMGYFGIVGNRHCSLVKILGPHLQHLPADDTLVIFVIGKYSCG